MLAFDVENSKPMRNIEYKQDIVTSKYVLANLRKSLVS
jgi:hypothetical protein